MAVARFLKNDIVTEVVVLILRKLSSLRHLVFFKGVQCNSVLKIIP
jgi:hypothetical protein